MNGYVVISEQASDGGWSGYVPDVPGVVVAGDSPEEVAQLMREALELYREELARRDEAMPPPTSEATVVEA